MYKAVTYLNAKQVYELTGITQDLLKYHRRKKHIKAVQLKGSSDKSARYYYPLEGLNKLIEGRQVLGGGQQIRLETVSVK